MRRGLELWTEWRATPGRGSSGGMGGSVYGSQPIGQPNTTMQPLIPETPLPKPQVVEDEACFRGRFPHVRGATVSVMRATRCPYKGKSDFEKACGDFRKKNLAMRNGIFVSAIEKYSNYSQHG